MAMFCFCFAPTFWAAVFIRFGAGLFMGLPPVVRCYLSDITDETNAPKGFVSHPVTELAADAIDPRAA